VSASQPESGVRVEELGSGALLRLTLDRPPANILDSAMTLELTRVFASLEERPETRAVLITGAGGHFSYGASVEEHRADRVEGMLRRFHELFRVIAKSGVVLLCAVRGQCLGGGLELASFGQRVFSTADAKLGQPEIVMGVLAPVASLLLSDRVGRGAADDLLLSGRTISGRAALEMGLVDELAEDPEQAAIEWAERSLAAHSASSLRHATRAARFELMQRFESCIAGIEALYLEELMKTHDATEGIQAFLEKRKPNWRDA